MGEPARGRLRHSRSVGPHAHVPWGAAGVYWVPVQPCRVRVIFLPFVARG